MKIIKIINNITTFLENFMVWIGSLGLVIMMLLVTLNVISRRIFNSPIVGAQEIVEMLMIITVFLGISYTQREKAHVGMDLIIEKILKGVVQRVTLFLIHCLGISISIIISIYTFEYFIHQYQSGSTTAYLLWPNWFLPLFVSFGFSILSIRLLLDLLEDSIIKKKISNH